MKTAVSVPNDVYDRAEALAKRERRSRSEVYSAALREYVARHDPDDVTAAIDEVVKGVGDRVDSFLSRAGRQTIERSDW